MSIRLGFVKGFQKKLIEEFLDKNNLSLNSASELLNVGKTTLKWWHREFYTLPQQVFDRMCEITPTLKIYGKYIEKKFPENWGRVKGGKIKVSKIKDVERAMSRIREIKNKKRLEKAISFKKKNKIKNKILKNLIKENVNLNYILAVCLLTDGSLIIDGDSYRIAYYTKDVVLKDFMKALLLKVSNFVPSENLDKKNVYAIRVNDAQLGKNLLKLSPSYTKLPQKNQDKMNYLKGVQPSLKFLDDINENTAKWCIRFAFTADGCISIRKNNKHELNLGCYHPTLPYQWIDILKRYGIFGHIKKNKHSWCGVSGIGIYDLKSIKSFYKLGGFVPGVKITNKSRYYKGLEKNTLLRKALMGG